jgi:uncharacterized protein (TIGR00725 family)
MFKSSQLPIFARRIAVGVMGPASGALTSDEYDRLATLARNLGSAIAYRGLLLVTGATTGIPDIVTRAARNAGGLTVGISPAASEHEHKQQFGLPADSSEVLIFSGFGLKGRNVINIRSSEIVLIFGGGMGTLNEFTIAYDEGKVIGALTGTGGIADHIGEIVGHCLTKPTQSIIVERSGPEELVDACLEALRVRNG